MTLKIRQMKVIRANDLERAFEDKYNYSIDLAPLLWGESYINDCFKAVAPAEAKNDAIWDYMANYDMIGNDDWQDYDKVIASFDLSTMAEGHEKNVIRVYDLLLELGIGENETILVDVSW